MSLIAGFICAYPMNWWLVTRHIKHGMMTVRADHGSSHAGHDMPASQHDDAHAEHAMQHRPPRATIAMMSGLSVLILAAAVAIVLALA
jgi:hypothetical protein